MTKHTLHLQFRDYMVHFMPSDFTTGSTLKYKCIFGHIFLCIYINKYSAYVCYV